MQRRDFIKSTAHCGLGVSLGQSWAQLLQTPSRTGIASSALTLGKRLEIVRDLYGSFGKFRKLSDIGRCLQNIDRIRLDTSMAADVKKNEINLSILNEVKAHESAAFASLAKLVKSHPSLDSLVEHEGEILREAKNSEHYKAGSDYMRLVWAKAAQTAELMDYGIGTQSPQEHFEARSRERQEDFRQGLITWTLKDLRDAIRGVKRLGEFLSLVENLPVSNARSIVDSLRSGEELPEQIRESASRLRKKLSQVEEFQDQFEYGRERPDRYDFLAAIRSRSIEEFSQEMLEYCVKSFVLPARRIEVEDGIQKVKNASENALMLQISAEHLSLVDSYSGDVFSLSCLYPGLCAEVRRQLSEELDQGAALF